MDIKKMAEDIAARLKEDEDLRRQFFNDPAGALKKLTGIQIPAGQLEALISGVKAKLTAGNVGDALRGLGGLLGKK